MNNIISYAKQVIHDRSVDVLIYASQHGVENIDRKLAPFASIIDYSNQLKTNPDAEMKNSEEFIGKRITEFIF